MKRPAQLLVVVLLAAMTFGGSFTCFASTNDNDDPPQKPRPAAPAKK